MVLILLLYASSLTVVVRSQNCTTNADCVNDRCCYFGSCSSNALVCNLFDRNDGRKDCFYNSQCVDGCCVDGKCHSSSSGECYQTSSYCFDDSKCSYGCCVDGRCISLADSRCKTCTYSWECDSNCCMENRCQETEERCHLTTATVNPTNCQYSFECTSYLEGCCVEGKCSACWHLPTIAVPTIAPFHDDYDYNYNNDDYDDDYDDDYGRKRSSGLSTGAYIGLVVASIAVFFVKIFFWTVWCGRIRRRRAVVVVRRTRCVGIVQHEEIQHEQAQPPEGIPGRLPPYSPQVDPPKYTPSIFPGGNPQISPDANSAPQRGPPPEYTPSDTTTPGEISTPDPPLPNQIQDPEEGFTNPLYAVQVNSTENNLQNPNPSPETEAVGTTDRPSQIVTNGPPPNFS